MLLKLDNRYQVSLHLYAGLEKELPGCCFRGFCGHVNSKCDMQVHNGLFLKDHFLFCKTRFFTISAQFITKGTTLSCHKGLTGNVNLFFYQMNNNRTLSQWSKSRRIRNLPLKVLRLYLLSGAVAI